MYFLIISIHRHLSSRTLWCGHLEKQQCYDTIVSRCLGFQITGSGLRGCTIFCYIWEEMGFETVSLLYWGNGDGWSLFFVFSENSMHCLVGLLWYRQVCWWRNNKLWICFCTCLWGINSLSSCARKLEGLFFCKLIGSFVAFVFLKAKGEYLSGQLEHASE